MVGLAFDYREGAVELFVQDYAEELMGQGYLSEADFLVDDVV